MVLKMDAFTNCMRLMPISTNFLPLLRLDPQFSWKLEI